MLPLLFKPKQVKRVQLMKVEEIKQHVLDFDRTSPVICPYCQKEAIYNQGYWRCNPCDAQTKCIKNSKEPVGTLAKKSLREARKKVGVAFSNTMQNFIDQGQSRHEARKQATNTLCQAIGMDTHLFNIERFDAKLCVFLEEKIKELNNKNALLCPYCGKNSVFIESKAIYRCEPCDAQVGSHKHNKKPLGTLANADLRKARTKAHMAFDPLWKRLVYEHGISTTKAREKMYSWLCKKMRMNFDNCHIGNFNEKQCEEVIRHCHSYQKTPPKKKRA